MEWDALKFEKAVQRGLSKRLSAVDGLKVVGGDFVPSVLKADFVIESAGGEDFVVEVKFVDDANRELHFGSVAQASSTTDSIAKSRNTHAKALLITNARVDASTREIADDVGVKIYQVDSDALEAGLDLVAEELSGPLSG